MICDWGSLKQLLKLFSDATIISKLNKKPNPCCEWLEPSTRKTYKDFLSVFMLIYSIRHKNLEVLIIFPRPLRVQEKLLTYTILKNYKLLRLVRDKFLKCDLLERVNQINAKNEFLTENSGTPQVNTHDSVCMCICSTHTSAKVY